jgi:hypothetical protein
MSKERDLAESPTTTAEGQQICSGSGSGSGSTSAAAAVEVAAAEGAAAIDWAIEGVKGLEGDALRHMNAFYVLLKDWFVQKNYTSVLLTRVPVSIWGSPLPYGDSTQMDPHYHTGIPIWERGLPYPHMEMVNHHFHMGIEKFVIPVSIWGSPYGNGD